MRTSSTSPNTMEWNDDVGESSASPLNMWQQSGSSASSNSLRSRSGLEQSTSSAGPMQSTLDNSKRQAHSKAVHSKGPSAAGGSCGGAGTSAAGSRGELGGAEGGSVGAHLNLDLHNPWSLFQHENKGKGWSPQKISAMYKAWKTNPRRKMP